MSKHSVKDGSVTTQRGVTYFVQDADDVDDVKAPPGVEVSTWKLDKQGPTTIHIVVPHDVIEENDGKPVEITLTVGDKKEKLKLG